MVALLGELAEIKGVRCSPHTFRHTFAAMYMRNGGNIYTLSKLLRHSSVKTTETYLQSTRQYEARHHGQSVVDKL
jgi:integrase/recombinase XerD